MEKVTNILDHQLGKEFDKGLPKFQSMVDAFFEIKATKNGHLNLKKLYYLTQSIEGTIRWFAISKQLQAEIYLDEIGKKLMIDWLESIINDIRKL